jgi:HAD superfamily hydrolase (TIGR01490 family)
MNEFVIFDVDGTLLRGQSQRLFIDYLFKKKIINMALYLKLYGWFILYSIGLANDPKKIMEEAYVFLKGKKYNWIENIVDDFFNNVLKKEFFKSAVGILNGHIKKNREVYLVSNLPDVLLKRIALYLNVQNYFGTILETKNGVFTGKIVGNIMYSENKADIVKKNILEKNPEPVDLWVYADHISDLPLFNIASHKFVVNPKNNLLKVAKEKDWSVLYLS